MSGDDGLPVRLRRDGVPEQSRDAAPRIGHGSRKSEAVRVRARSSVIATTVPRRSCQPRSAGSRTDSQSGTDPAASAERNASRREDGTTVISTLHDLTLAGQYADRVLLLDGGEMVAAGPPAEVLTPERVARYYDADVDVVTVGGRQVVVPVRSDAS